MSKDRSYDHILQTILDAEPTGSFSNLRQIIGKLVGVIGLKPAKYILIQYNQHLQRSKFNIVNNTHPPKPPPPREGKLIQTSLSYKARRRIKDACWLLGKNQKVVTFITLTYGKDYPDDYTSKKHIKNFVERAHYHFKKTGKIFAHCWVLEKQKRGAPHFHLCSKYYLDYQWVHKAFNSIVGKWLEDEGLEPQEVKPDVIGRAVRGYMAKGGNKVRVGDYMAKGMDFDHPIKGKLYGMDKYTSAAIRDTKEIIPLNSLKEGNEILEKFGPDENSSTSLRFFKWLDRNGLAAIFFAENPKKTIDRFNDFLADFDATYTEQSEPKNTDNREK